MRLFVLRPQPGADATAARAAALGMTPVIAPLFTIVPLAWEAADPAPYDALMLTSANAPRHAGAGIGRYAHLPCYAVGAATAEAARGAGLRDIRIGPSDGDALVGMMAGDGVTRALHIAGAHRTVIDPRGIAFDVRAVYRADAVTALPDALTHIPPGMPEDGVDIALIHSPRAGRALAAMADDALRRRLIIAAISAAAAEAAGGGWHAMHFAAADRDAALLELAAKLCQKDAGTGVKRA